MVMIRCKVIGENEVAGATPGHEVEINDELVNIPALVEGGHVEVLPAEPAAPVPATPAPAEAATS